MNTDAKIAIVGAGVSGLAAASRLVRLGFRNLSLFEARREPGGRTRSYVDPTTGDTLDNGQHLMMGCYTSTLDYLRWTGTAHLVSRESLSIPFHSPTGESVLRIPNFGPPFNLLTGLWRTRLLTAIEKAAATRFGNAILRRKLPEGYERMTCSQLFAATWQPETLVERLWAPMILATINADVYEASAAIFVNVVREVFFASRASSTLLIPQAGLSELLIDPAIQKLGGAGIEVRCGTPVRAIEQIGAEYLLVVDGETFSFEAIVLASSTAIGPIRPIGPMGKETSYSPIINAYFWVDREILEGPIHSFLGTTLQWAFPKPSGYASQRLALTVSAAGSLSDKSNEEIRDILWEDMRQTVAEARDTALVHYQIIREKRATPLFTPRRHTDRPTTQTTLPNVVLAGDLVQNGLPATIEGAVRNGYAAADELVRA